MNLLRKKPITQEINTDSSLRSCLTAFDLVLLGIGAIIGAGVFVLTGVAAATKAGPGVCISYIIAGFAAMFAAFAYAELATSIGGCGSAYNYAYTGFGELIAWIIGWDLLLEYMLSVSTVAIGWSGYVNNALQSLNISIPSILLKNPAEGGVINILAAAIIFVLAALLCIGTKESSRFNIVIVFIKLFAIAIFVVVAIGHVNFNNWQHFFPFGWTGVMQGAALVFFAYIGFDALSTATEETENPQRNVPIGIIVSMIICTTIYIIVSALLTGIVPYTTLNVKSPVSQALLNLGYPFAAGMVAAGAIAGLTTVMLVMYYGLTRVFLAISRDGLLPRFFAHTHQKTKTPVRIILLTGLIIATVAGFFSMDQVAELVNIGTLAAFTLVCSGVIILRITQPSMPRPFKLSWNPLIPLLGIFFCVYLMLNLPAVTWWRFIIWMAIGFIIYFSYGIKRSTLNE